MKESKDYYKSYRDLFLRSRRKAAIYRYLSGLQSIPLDLVQWSVIPVIPLGIWFANKYFFNLKLNELIKFGDFNFLTIWLYSILLFSGIYFLIFGTIAIFYRIQKKNIIRRSVYPFSLLSEAIIELNSFSVNKDKRRLDRGIDFFFDYNFIERKNDLILIRPLGNSGYSIGTRGKAYKKILDTLEEVHWFEATPKSKTIAEAFDFFHEDIYESIENEIEIESTVKAVEGLQVYEYAINKNEEIEESKYEKILEYALNIFQKNMATVISTFKSKIKEKEDEVFESGSFNRILPQRKLSISILKWFLFLVIALSISVLVGMYIADLKFDSKLLALIIGSSIAGSIAISIKFTSKEN